MERFTLKFVIMYELAPIHMIPKFPFMYVYTLNKILNATYKKSLYYTFETAFDIYLEQGNINYDELLSF